MAFFSVETFLKKGVVFLEIDKKNKPAEMGAQQVEIANINDNICINYDNTLVTASQLKSVEKEIDDRFLQKRKQGDLLAVIYKQLELYRRSERVQQCGSFLEFGIFPEKNRLLFANFCRDRLCPMCNWRKSLKTFGQVSLVMNELEHQGYQFIFATFTIKNCRSEHLRITLEILIQGFRKLFHDNNRIKKSIKGVFRSIEITKNSKTGEYHPHIHCILAVRPDYFSRNYITQREWSEFWAKCIDVDYNPIVDIRRIKGENMGIANELTGALNKVSNYAVKGSDFLNSQAASDIDSAAQTVSVFLSALTNRQLIAFTGVFAKVRKQLKLDDIENGNLIQTDIENLRNDVAIAIVRYGYKNGVYALENIRKGGECL